MSLNRREALKQLQLCAAGVAAGMIIGEIERAEAAPQAGAAQVPYTPTSHYATLTVEGWTVRASRSLQTGHPALYRDVLKLLESKLYAITRAVPAPALAHLRSVPIWLEYREGHHPCMVYHPDAQWLREHDMNPEKARCVEIAGAENFLSWERDQPWMVLHELAHSYHDQVFGFDNADIKRAYDLAVQSKTYESVLRISGQHERHYALTNPQEYFAECSEAFFGTNDFYPFVRAELREHDPTGYHVLEKSWGIG
jgi:hypothetical protein